MGIRIIGTGSALPCRVVTNQDLTAYVDTSDEWIRTRTGIEQRRILTGDESLRSLGKEAVAKALADAGVRAEEIDVLICTSIMTDYISPALACLLSADAGMRTDCVTMDLNMGCCGFIYALSVADAYLASSHARRVMVVGAEAVTRQMDFTDRSVCCLFGDACAAAVVESCSDKSVFDMQVQGDAQELHVSRPADDCPFHPDPTKNGLYMNGQEIYKFAVGAVADRIRDVMEKGGLSDKDVDAYLLHQANLRIIRSAIMHLHIDPAKAPHNIERYGNTSSASIPLLLDELRHEGAVRTGQRLLLCAFGAGLASAACTVYL